MSVRATAVRSTTEENRSDKEDRLELRSLKQQHSQQVQGLKQIIQSQSNRLDEIVQAPKQKDETIAAEKLQINQLEREKSQALE